MACILQRSILRPMQSNKFADDPKLEAAVKAFKEEASIQRDLGNPEELVKRNLMKYSMDKYSKSCTWDRLILPRYRLGIDWQGPAKQQAKP